ncbi:flagellin N-terminal helical domain-containing protein [Acidithiobacillus ferrivorans]|uniref:Flagellin n=1 Tax=Acidithiobacillus ferrivorans TaxID=160808 RepID=A0A1B9BWN6_9PROT|nr:flagellin [Acidithiobacillus ferrivorans]OCB02132.1 flagellar protein FlaB [Acidithiobacillus ferrivorans]QQD72034.1 flagellar protein FlaB [Acidithiobacillus ferrivorans]
MSTAFGSINTNVSALSALNSLGSTNQTITGLENQLSTGLSINSPANNPAGYTIAQGFTTQINGSNQGISNANQAVSLLQTATGALGQQTNILQNVRTIAVQAANGSNTSADLASLQSTVGQLVAQVSTIAQQTQFNGISLLNGSFAGVQFQVGANQGQVIDASVGSTAATNLGVYQTAAASGTYSGGSTTGGNSYVISSSGAFTSGSMSILGSVGSGSVTVSSSGESAASVAASVNNVSNLTGVNAQAYTSVAFNVTSTGDISFSLGNGTNSGQTNAVNISASVTGDTAAGLSSLVQSVNNNTSTTGIAASVNTSNQLVLTDVNGNNVSIANFSGTVSLGAGATTLASGGSTGATVQGLVSFQSANAFTVSGGSNVGVTSGSTLTNLTQVNVGTQQGASNAITIISYALQQLNQQGTQLGAVQQRVQSALSNLQTTATNDQAAQSVIQDANIPQVSTNLTQAQILQQAGIGALSASSQTQQAYLKLIP